MRKRIITMVVDGLIMAHIVPNVRRDGTNSCLEFALHMPTGCPSPRPSGKLYDRLNWCANCPKPDLEFTRISKDRYHVTNKGNIYANQV